MDEIPSGWLDWLGFYSFWLTQANRFSATGFRHFQLETANSGHSTSKLAVSPWITEDHGLNSGILATRTYNRRNYAEYDIINHGSRYAGFEGGVGEAFGWI
jgi:hypothetical protein